MSVTQVTSIVHIGDHGGHVGRDFMSQSNLGLICALALTVARVHVCSMHSASHRGARAIAEAARPLSAHSAALASA